MFHTLTVSTILTWNVNRGSYADVSMSDNVSSLIIVSVRGFWIVLCDSLLR